MLSGLDLTDTQRYRLLDTVDRTSGSIRNCRFDLSEDPVRNVKAIKILDVFLFNSELTINDDNKYFYFNDGSDQIATIAKKRYDGSNLASALQTAMNAVSSGFTVSYDDDTLKFTITNASSFTIQSNTFINNTDGSSTNIWKRLGIDTSSDKTGTSITSDNMAVLTSKYNYIVSDIVSAGYTNSNLPDNIMLVVGNTQNFGNLLSKPSNVILKSSYETIDKIDLKIYNDDKYLSRREGVDYGLLLEFIH